MPKLNVQQNNANVIKALRNALAIGQIKGPIASDGADNFSSAGSNRNLLDNAWFRINQRSTTGGTHTDVPADRWLATYGGGGVTWSRTDDTITIQSTSGASHGDLYQNLEPSLFSDLMGKTVTSSVMLNDYSIISATFKFPTSGNRNVLMGTGLDGNNINCVIYSSNKRFEIEKFYTAETYRAFKLELGSVSTLANDAPPNYAEELLKCLRYQWVIDAESVYGVVGDATVTTQNTEAMMVVHYPVPMYKVPTLSVRGTFRTVGGNGTAVVVGSVTSMAVTSNASNKNFARVTINGTTMGGTGTSVVVGANGAGAKLIFDANI